MDEALYIEMINLAGATDRRDHMKTELAQCNVAAEMHPAVDVSEVSEDELYAQVMREGPWGYVAPTQAACTVSHLQVWQRFLNSDKTHCLVLEDDIHISPELGHWTGSLAWWPADADIVKLERWRGRTLKILLDQEASTHLGRRISRMYSRHVGAAGYVLSRKAAQRVLASQPLPLVVDNLLFNMNASRALDSLRLYQVQPALIVQGNEPPDQAQRPFIPYRPKGAMLARQKLKRAYFEIAYPPSTWGKLMTRAIRFERIDFAEDAIGLSAPSHASHARTSEIEADRSKTLQGDDQHGRID